VIDATATTGPTATVKGGGATAAGTPGSAFQSLHFDHTSILKTIARRFMSKHPPYMGARYAAARDLSQVIGNELRPGQFRPFIPYTLTYGALRLEVPGGSDTPGTALRQFIPNATGAQEFRFEDAGDGFFYLRTHSGKLYVTVDVPAGANTGAGQTLAIKQDVKYTTGGTGPHDPDFQKWKFGLSGLTTNKDNISISNAAFPAKVLQPAGGSVQPNAAVVLGEPSGTHISILLKNPWQVTSPLLPSGVVILQA
jgi:hypothetical protein